MTVLLIYDGYALHEWGHGYKSEIDGEWLQFDTAGQWKQFIDRKRNERKERNNRH